MTANPYSPGCLEGVFSATRVPASKILGTSGHKKSRGLLYTPALSLLVKEEAAGTKRLIGLARGISATRERSKVQTKVVAPRCICKRWSWSHRHHYRHHCGYRQPHHYAPHRGNLLSSSNLHLDAPTIINASKERTYQGMATGASAYRVKEAAVNFVHRAAEKGCSRKLGFQYSRFSET